jgi:hypothetical protein
MGAGGVTAGQVVDKDGNPVYEYAADGQSKGSVSRVAWVWSKRLAEDAD